MPESRPPLLDDTRKLGFLLVALLASAVAAIVVTSFWAKGLADDQTRTNDAAMVFTGISNYDDTFHRLPHDTRGPDGTLATSWRVDMMPLLFAMKHERDPELPWTTPVNSYWRGSVHYYYCGRTTNARLFCFLPQTVGGGADVSHRLRDLPPETLLFLRTPRDSDIHWMEPRDLTLDEALSPEMCPPGDHVFVAFADGQIWKLTAESKNELRRFLDPEPGLPHDERQRVLAPFGRWMNPPAQQD